MHADEPIEALVWQLPRALLGAAAPRIEALTALRIPGSAALTRLTAQFFVGVAAGVADGEIARDDANAAERVIDLVRGLYSQRIERGAPARSRSSTELLLGAKAVIEAGLGNPDLGPEEVARACFISTRYLHRLFESEGLSVCEWIRAERLDRCRRDLHDPTLADRDDPLDREPLGAAELRALQPPVPRGLRLLAARVPARRASATDHRWGSAHVPTPRPAHVPVAGPTARTLRHCAVAGTVHARIRRRLRAVPDFVVRMC